jgi:hypothetical protein
MTANLNAMGITPDKLADAAGLVLEEEAIAAGRMTVNPDEPREELIQDDRH